MNETKIESYYGSYSIKLVKRNFRLHNPNLPLLIGNVNDNDIERKLGGLVILIYNKNYFKLLTYSIIILIFSNL